MKDGISNFQEQRLICYHVLSSKQWQPNSVLYSLYKNVYAQMSLYYTQFRIGIHYTTTCILDYIWSTLKKKKNKKKRRKIDISQKRMGKFPMNIHIVLCVLATKSEKEIK